jgi:hypothetical protein
MTETFRILVAAFAIAATVLTAGMAGAARGQAAEAGRVVICSGQGAVTLSIDADGNPTGPAHWCPDCVLTLLAGLAAAPAVAEAPAGVSAAAPAPLARRQPGRSLPGPQARGPPVS